VTPDPWLLAAFVVLCALAFAGVCLLIKSWCKLREILRENRPIPATPETPEKP
jgi:hypothetical protein